MPKEPKAKTGKARPPVKEQVTRDYTINLHKRLHKVYVRSSGADAAVRGDRRPLARIRRITRI